MPEFQESAPLIDPAQQATTHAAVLERFAHEPGLHEPLVPYMQDWAQREAAGLTLPQEATTAETAETYAAQRADAEIDGVQHEITAFHHQSHIEQARAFDNQINERPTAVQDLLGEVGELGETAIDHDLAEQPAGLLAAEAKTEPTNLAAELSALPEMLRPRIEKALNDSEFERSPELDRSVESYYVDHARLGKVIEGISDNTISVEAAQKIADGEFDGPSYAMNQTIKRLVASNQDPTQREVTLRDASEVVTRMLLNEKCVGALTADKTDFAVIPKLYEKVRKAAVRDGVAFAAGEGSAQNYYWQTPRSTFDLTQRMFSETRITDIAESRERLANEVWEDSRFAGQLLFHNTANMDKIALDGYKLKSRSAQVAKTGSFVAYTAIMNQQHTNVIHWSENFDYQGYRGTSATHTDGSRSQPGTIAVPLAEMIKIAPYARNGEYGVLQPKPEVDLSRITINDRIGEIGSGRFDMPGKDGMDRVFFGDYKAANAQAAHAYVIDAGRGMSTEAGNTSYQLFLDNELDREKDVYKDNFTYGIGQNLPLLKTLHLDAAHKPSAEQSPQISNQQTVDAVHKQEREIERSIEDQIAELQQTSRQRPEFAGRVIVPLRQGVIEFTNEANSHVRNDAFLQYSQAPNVANEMDATVLRAARVAKGVEMSDEQIAKEREKEAIAEAAYAAVMKQKADEMAETGETEEQYEDRKHKEFIALPKPLI